MGPSVSITAFIYIHEPTKNDYKASACVKSHLQYSVPLLNLLQKNQLCFYYDFIQTLPPFSESILMVMLGRKTKHNLHNALISVWLISPSRLRPSATVDYFEHDYVRLCGGQSGISMYKTRSARNAKKSEIRGMREHTARGEKINTHQVIS